MTTSSTSLHVAVDVFGSMRRYLPPGENGPMRHTCAGPATVADVLRELAIEPEEDMAISLNGELAAMESDVQDGDSLTLFGPMEGG